MSKYNYSRWHIPGFLVVAVAITFSAAAPLSAQAQVATRSPADEEKIEIRKEEEHTLKKETDDYVRQTSSLAQQYRETAKLVASQGGDPKALLEAADYFDSQSEIESSAFSR